MPSISQIRSWGRSPVRVTLQDGLIIDVVILDALDDQDHDQVAYRLLSLVKQGASARPRLVAGEHYTTDLIEIVELGPVPNAG